MSCNHSSFFTLFLFLCICLYPKTSFGNNTTQRDSLLKLIEQPQSSDSAKLQAYIQLSQLYRKEPLRAMKCIESGQSLAMKIDDRISYWNLELSRGRFLCVISKYQDAIYAFKEVAQFGQLSNDLDLEGRAFNSLGIVFGMLQRYDSSAYYLDESVEIFKKLGKDDIVQRIYNNLGNNLSRNSQFASALEYYKEAWKFLQQSQYEKDEKLECKLLNNIGLMYFRLKQYESAKDYFQKSKLLSKKLGLDAELGLSTINLGSTYYYLGLYDVAQRLIPKGIELCIRTGDNYPIGLGYFFLGKIYEKKGKYTSALEAFQLAKQYEEKTKSLSGKTLTAISQAQARLGNISEALSFAHKGLDLSLKFEKMENAAIASELLSSLYEKEGQTKRALEYARNATNYRVEAIKKASENDLLRLRTEFETDQKELALMAEKVKVGELDKKIADEANKKRLLQVMLGSLGLILLFSLAFGYRIQEMYKKLKRLSEAVGTQRDQLAAQASELKIRNKDLEQFSMALGHDLKQPLTTIKGYASLLDKTIPKYTPMEMQNAATYLHSLQKGITRMEKRIENLLAYYRTGVKMKRQGDVDLNQVLEDVQNDLHQAIEESRANIQVSDLPNVKGDPDLFAQLFQNLIANSIKYSKPQTPPKIAIHPNKNGKFWKIAVQDNGIGIDEDSKHDVFALFNRVNVNNGVSGEGIGLATCKRIIELHGGEIDVNSSPEGGTTFTLYIPLSRN
ncbi:MAG: tetratricopeptide repeat protein [Bacteroidota bacterium]